MMVASMLRQAQPPQVVVEPVETTTGEKSYDNGFDKFSDHKWTLSLSKRPRRGEKSYDGGFDASTSSATTSGR